MTLAADLLDQADRLARQGKGRPKQANLRRAVSTAYYALFHLLGAEAADRLVPATPRDLGALFQRAMDHATMKRICRSFADAKAPPALDRFVTSAIEAELATVAEAFVELQRARHAADYDVLHTLTRRETLDLIGAARDAFVKWRIVRRRPNANLFLLALAVPRIADSRS